MFSFFCDCEASKAGRMGLKEGGRAIAILVPDNKQHGDETGSFLKPLRRVEGGGGLGMWPGADREW